MANTQNQIITAAKKMITDKVVYGYGYKYLKVTEANLASFAKLYPGNYTATIKSLMKKKIGKTAIDCSGFVCRAAGISHIGSSQIKSSAPKSWPVSNLGNIKNGMFIWKSGHVGIVEIEPSGKMWILEAQSTSADLKRNAFDSRYKSFTHYGEIKGVSYTASPAVTPKPDATKADIKIVQTYLNKTYQAKLAVDGIYGKNTKAALIRGLQSSLNTTYKAGLATDGIWGPKTKAACRNIVKGNRGALVYLLQGSLICNGYSVGGLDGIYGDNTLAALKGFKKAKNLSLTAAVDKTVWERLLK